MYLHDRPQTALPAHFDMIYTASCNDHGTSCGATKTNRHIGNILNNLKKASKTGRNVGFKDILTRKIPETIQNFNFVALSSILTLTLTLCTRFLSHMFVFILDNTCLATTREIHHVSLSTWLEFSSLLHSKKTAYKIFHHQEL